MKRKQSDLSSFFPKRMRASQGMLSIVCFIEHQLFCHAEPDVDLEGSASPGL
jgi:hypothetical protein